MKYISTRGDAAKLGFCDAVLTGLARDGGLFVPETWPQLSSTKITEMAGKSYSDIAMMVLSPFVDGEIPDSDLRVMIEEAYGDFGHDAVAPLIQSGPNEYILELFHGPTMAFKDVAMQLLSRIVDHILNERGKRVTIVGATSGDTGGAAIEAFKGRDNSDIFILFPNGKVSDVQRWQMTGVTDANVHAIAIEGNFDDCQTLVKDLFNNLAFRDKLSLSGVNSINWGRIMAQVVYYFTSAVALGAPDKKISFTVPTGNFGDIFAGFVAKKMGLPIDKLIIATNSNDILPRTLETGRYEMSGVAATTSPSMDIQISSNFERLLFEASGRDSDIVNGYMGSLAQSGSFSIADENLNKVKAEFVAGRASEEDVAQTIASVLQNNDYLLDPHSAVGVHVARQNVGDSPMVILATAHPAKFPDAVEAACGQRPALPEKSKDLMRGQERFTVLENDPKILQDFISSRSRASS